MDVPGPLARRSGDGPPGNILGVTFHPELTGDRRVHELFLRTWGRIEMAETLCGMRRTKGIHRLTMDHGPNALDRPLMTGLRSVCERLADDGAPAVF